MKIITIPCAFDNFAYLLVCETTQLAAVIDPTEAYPVWRESEAAGAKLASVLCTHHHHDHIGGLEDLLSEQPELKVFAHESDKDRIKGATDIVRDGSVVTVGSLEGSVIHTPGHTKGSICYHFKDVLFTGDTLFGGGCGRLFEGTPEQMNASLNERIGNLPDTTRLYFGHEYTEKNLEFARNLEPENPEILSRIAIVRQRRNQDRPTSPSTLIEEKLTNPFFRCAEKSMRRNFLTTGPDAPESEIFALIRQQRNSFQ